MSAKQSKVSKCKTPTQATPRATSGVLDRPNGALRQLLREKGWSVRDAADYLGVSRQRLYSVFSDPRRIKLWGCAVTGMPVCTKEIKLALKAERDGKPKPPPPIKIQEHGLEINDILICDKYAGIAEEGDEGWISALRGEKDKLEVLVKMPAGEDWFPLEDFHEYFAATGRTHHADN